MTNATAQGTNAALPTPAVLNGFRSGLPRVPPRLPVSTDVVEHLTLSDGRLGVRVALHGKHGDGKTMILDAADWMLVRMLYGPRWIVVMRGGHPFVMGTVKPARGLPLAQVIVGAGKGERVIFRDGDRLNFTRSNLDRPDALVMH